MGVNGEIWLLLAHTWLLSKLTFIVKGSYLLLWYSAASFSSSLFLSQLCSLGCIQSQAMYPTSRMPITYHPLEDKNDVTENK